MKHKQSFLFILLMLVECFMVDAWANLQTPDEIEKQENVKDISQSEPEKVASGQFPVESLKSQLDNCMSRLDTVEANSTKLQEDKNKLVHTIKKLIVDRTNLINQKRELEDKLMESTNYENSKTEMNETINLLRAEIKSQPSLDKIKSDLEKCNEERNTDLAEVIKCKLERENLTSTIKDLLSTTDKLKAEVNNFQQANNELQAQVKALIEKLEDQENTEENFDGFHDGHSQESIHKSISPIQLFNTLLVEDKIKLNDTVSKLIMLMGDISEEKYTAMQKDIKTEQHSNISLFTEKDDNIEDQLKIKASEIQNLNMSLECCYSQNDNLISENKHLQDRNTNLTSEILMLRDQIAQLRSHEYNERANQSFEFLDSACASSSRSLETEKEFDISEMESGASAEDDGAASSYLDGSRDSTCQSGALEWLQAHLVTTLAAIATGMLVISACVAMACCWCCPRKHEAAFPSHEIPLPPPCPSGPAEMSYKSGGSPSSSGGGGGSGKLDTLHHPGRWVQLGAEPLQMQVTHRQHSEHITSKETTSI